jgi:hypothetical protein
MNYSQTRLLLAGLILFGALRAPAEPSINSLKVGTAKRDITPHEAVPMWGYGARHDSLSTGVLDLLHATTLVIQAGSNKLAIVGLDLGRSPTEAHLRKIRERIRVEAGIAYSLVAGSHTHHGPVLELTDEPGKGQGKFDAALRYCEETDNAVIAAIPTNGIEQELIVREELVFVGFAVNWVDG